MKVAFPPVSFNNGSPYPSNVITEDPVYRPGGKTSLMANKDVVVILDDDDEERPEARKVPDEPRRTAGGPFQAVFTRADKKPTRKHHPLPPLNEPNTRLRGAANGSIGSSIFSSEEKRVVGRSENGSVVIRIDEETPTQASDPLLGSLGSQEASHLNESKAESPADVHPEEGVQSAGQCAKNSESPVEFDTLASKKQRERAFISCPGNTKRLRSSAVRDYPDGCAKVSSVRDFPDVCTKVSSVLPMGSLVNASCVAAKISSVEPGEGILDAEKEGSSIEGPFEESFAKDVAMDLTIDNNHLSESKDHVVTTEFSPSNVKEVVAKTESCLSRQSSQELLACEQEPTSNKKEKSVLRKNSSPSNKSRLHNSFGENHDARVHQISRNHETGSGDSIRSLVKRTLHEFECIRKAFVKAPQPGGKRPDIEAANILKQRNKWRNCGEKIIGEVPGIEVGDQFTCRLEMCVVGLHRPSQAGIDFIAGSRRSNGKPLATSIVASGGYEDDDDGGDTFIYTGQGGNNFNGDKRQGKDQELLRGNLALKTSMLERSPVRVIRGSIDPSSGDKLYTYDGLYDVVDVWEKPGVSGFKVFQFKLTRRPGQPELGSSMVNFVGNLRKKGIARPNLLLGDISEGQERLAVCVVNEVDDEAAPTWFVYMSRVKYPSWYSPVLPKGCDCVGNCVDEKKCLCAAKNGGEFPYNESGYLMWDKQVVYECGPSCRCSSSCQNRVSQRGLRYQLEVFKTKNRGWGVRSLNSIRSGGFICEYTGELLSDAEAEQRTGSDEYLFDIGNKCGAWSDVSGIVKTSEPTNAVAAVIEEVGFTIDAKDFGSVARFINHSCSPNLFAQNVLYDSDDLRFPHVMLFAMENIPPMRELSYDYNYTVGHVRDANGNVKTKACYCGAQDCSGRLY